MHMKKGFIGGVKIHTVALISQSIKCINAVVCYPLIEIRVFRAFQGSSDVQSPGLRTTGSHFRSDLFVNFLFDLI